MEIKQVRQGDVLLVRVDAKPFAAKVKPANGRVTLAFGEASGHSHAVGSAYGTLTEDPTTHERRLEIRRGTALLHGVVEHTGGGRIVSRPGSADHMPIDVTNGVYDLPGQYEYDETAEMRRVED